jgi:hypothetical protein
MTINEQADQLRGLEPGWDGHEAPAISEAAIQSAIRTVRSLPHLTQCANGGVQIDYPNGVEITFLPDGEQDFGETEEFAG